MNIFKTMNEDNNAYTEYYKRLKARGKVPSDYKGNIHHHHFRLEKDTLRDDNDFIECTMEEHTELHKLMYECYPCAITKRVYEISTYFKDRRGIKVKHTKKFYLKRMRKVLQIILQKKEKAERKEKRKEVKSYSKHKKIIEEQEKEVYRQLGLL